MNYSDIERSYEWETQFHEWLSNKVDEVKEPSTTFDDIPEIKKEYSENFILQSILDEN